MLPFGEVKPSPPPSLSLSQGQRSLGLVLAEFGVEFGADVAGGF